MYIIGDKELSDEQARDFAAKFGGELDAIAEKYNWQYVAGDEGKTTVPAETTPPTEPVKETAAGDSSLADTSLESPEANPYLLTLEDLEGSEEDVYDRLNSKMRAIGIKLTEEGLGTNKIRLQSIQEYDPKTNRGAYVKRSLKDDNREQVLADFNSFIEQYADENYAAQFAEGREDLLKEYEQGLKNVKISDEEVEDSLIAQKAAKWRKMDTLDFGMGQRSEITLKESDFDSPEEFKAYQNWKETGLIEPSSTEVANAKVDMLEAKKSKVSQGYINALPSEDREALETVTAKNKLDLQIRIGNLESEKNSLEANNFALTNDIKAYEENPTEEGYLAIKRDAAALIEQESDYNSFLDTLQSEETQIALRATQDFSKTYNLISKLGVNFKDLAINIGYGAYQITNALGAAKLAATIPGVGIGEAFEAGIKTAEQNAKEILQGAEKEKGRLSQGVAFEDIDLSKPSTLINWAGNTAVQAIPSLTMAFTGPAAMPLFFASGYGSKAAELATQEYAAADRMLANKKLLVSGTLTDEERLSIEAQMDADAEIVNMPLWKEMSVSAISGAAEVVFERLGTMAILKGVNKAVNPLRPQIAKAVAKSANREGLTEAATEITNNFASIYILGEDKNIMDGALESYAGGALIGAPLQLKQSLPAVYKNLAHQYMTNAEIEAYRSKIEKIKELSGLENIDSLLNPAAPLPKNISPEIKQLIEEVQTEGELLEDNAISRMNSRLSAEDLAAVGEANLKMRQINQRLISLAESGASIAEIDAAKNTLQEQFDNLSSQREAILTDNSGQRKAARHNASLKVSIDAKTAFEVAFKQELAQKQAMSGARFDKLDDVSKNKYLKKAKESGAENINQAAKLEFFIETNKKQLAVDEANARNLLEELGLTNQIISLSDAEFRKKFPKSDKNTDAFIDDATGDIYINVDKSAASGKVAVYSHELLHAVAKQSIGNDAANKAGEKLLNWLENNTTETSAYIKNKLDFFYKEGDVKDAAYYEEAMNALSDYIAEGNKVDLGALTQINLFLNKVFSKSSPQLSIEDGAQTFAFIAEYANKNRNAKTKAIIKNFVDEAKGLDEEEAPVSNKKSKSLLSDINALVPESVQTQEQFFDRKVFNPIYNDGKLHPAIANYIRSRSVSKEEAQKIIESVGDRLINFNPEAKRKSGDARITLGEFIFSNVNFGKLDARKALFEEGQERAQTESTDSETAKQVVAREDVSTPVAEKPVYKSLIQRRIVDADVLESIKAKVKSTVRVMKTRMDESVSKNVTVKPYIAELRKAMGKQADIDLKKAMGGKKDGQLRKFLLRNKAAILENMTTTYLMTAMPNAIQKKVDGVWTSDWKGKKIDRESVDTDKAGRTSGAELVRRLPNASTRLSDADYLSNILDASGAPMRGRKESLAKAISEELSFDIINDALQDPNSEIRKAYESRQELLGTELSDAFVQEVARDVERGSVKRSASIRAMSPEQRMAWESKRDEFSKRMVGVDEDYSVRSIRNDLKAVYGDTFTAKQYSDLAKDLLKIFKSIKRIDIKELGIAKEDISDILKDIDNDIDFVENVHKMTGASATVADLFRSRAKIAESKEAIVDILKLNNVPAAVAKSFMARTFANSGRIGVFKKDGTVKKDSRQDFFYNVADVQSALVGEGKLYTQEEWDNAETMAASADVKASYLNGKFENSAELRAQDAATANAAWELTSTIVKGLKNYSPDVQAMVIAAMNSGTNTVARVAAPVTHIAEGATSKNTKSYRYEHATPARAILALMFKSYVQGDKSIDMDALKADYKVAIIPLAMDKVVTAAGFAARQAIGYVPGQTPWYKRYYNIFTLGKIQYALKPFAGGELIGEKYAKAYNTKQSFDVNSKQYLKAVKDVKAVETTKASKSIDTSLSKEFNNILERKTGVEAFKTFSAVQAQKRGEKKGRFKFFIAPSVDDFRGLVNYAFAGKGKQGEADMKWLEDNLMTPYAKGIAAINGIRQQIKRDFKTAVKAFPKQYQLLNKEIGKTGFTYDQAVRVYLWGKAGIKVPGLSQKDTKILQDAIRENPELMDFADAMLVVARRDTWMEPSEHWSASTLLSDLNSMTEKIGRKKYLEEFIANADAIFTEENLNKIEALYGRAHRDAIVDALYSMKNGTNREKNTNKQINAWLNWINGSTGAIMFFNRRSALLQMLSTVNFINYSDNNPLKAAAAFANQKQYWTDWAMIFNSDKLKERRGGLKQDVSSNEIASIANANKNSPQAILAKLLRLGFTPTQIADSMAIASGGATFYRNRVNTYLKKGMTQKEAEQQAFLDFSKISDETQQSSDPALVSQVQRSNLGRLVFAFQNTPMQMTRLMKKDALDIINGRGDWRAKVARITYYGAIQNFIFSSLQSALFAMLPGFDDDDEDLTAAELDKKNAKEEAKIARVLNSMLDTLLRGSGVYGAVFSTVKNVIREYNKQEKKGFMSEHAYTVLSLFNISPPIGSKARKIHSAIQTRKFEKDEIAARGWGVVADGRLDLGPNWSILGKVLSAAVSVPLDRVVDELTSISEAFDARNKAWQRIALALGWKTWDVGAIEENAEAIKAAAKKKRKEAGVEKAKETRAANKKAQGRTRNVKTRGGKTR